MMPFRIFQLMSAALRLMPRWHFDHSLYEELVRERQIKGSKIPAPQAEPQVAFAMGPIDGVLGFYDIRTNMITIDLLEHMFSLLVEGVNPADLKRRFDERLTKTLAHEGGHWHLQKIRGRLANLERRVMLFAFGLLGILIGGGFSFGISRLCLRVIIPFVLHNIGGWLEPILAIAVLAGGFILIIKFAAALSRSWHFIAWATTYRLCYSERFARGFEARVDQDQRWDNVINVE